MAELSPQAQAVLDACMAGAGWRIGPLQMDRRSAAAALRAAAEQGKLGPDHWAGNHPDQQELGWNAAMTWLEDVADELEGSDD